VFAITGGSVAKYLNLRILEVINAAISVARLPKTISHRAQPVSKLDIKHPIKTPGMAAGKYRGRIVKASENLICITPLARPKRLVNEVKMTYSAAIIAA